MSRLIEIDPQVQQEPQPEGYEFGYYTFDNLPNNEVTDIESTFNSITDIETKDTSGYNFQGCHMIESFCLDLRSAPTDRPVDESSSNLQYI